MLPFGHDLANLLQNLDMSRKALWDVIESVNNLDKEKSDVQFKEFKQSLTVVNKEVERLTRDSKLYNKEYQDTGE